MNSPARWVLFCLTVGVLTGCSPDIIPVGRSRVASAKRAGQPLPRGPASAGAFTQTWDFDSASGGFFIDPVHVDLSGGIARLRPAAKGMSGFRAELIQSRSSHPFATLYSFEAVAGPGNQGTFKFQLSNDGSKWYFHDGAQWKQAATASTQANTAQEVNAQISHFDLDVGPGMVFVRVFLIAPKGTEQVELKQLKIGGVNAPTDAWD